MTVPWCVYNAGKAARYIHTCPMVNKKGHLSSLCPYFKDVFVVLRPAHSLRWRQYWPNKTGTSLPPCRIRRRRPSSCGSPRAACSRGPRQCPPCPLPSHACGRWSCTDTGTAGMGAALASPSGAWWATSGCWTPSWSPAQTQRGRSVDLLMSPLRSAEMGQVSEQ